MGTELDTTGAGSPDTARATGRLISELFRAHSRRVYRYARVRVGPEDAADIVSEVFLVVTRRPQDVPEEALPWLLGVARKIMANTIRGGSRRDALVDRLESVPEGHQSDHAASVVELQFLATALDRLPLIDQETIALLATADLTTIQMAQALDCSRSAAAVRIHRARKRLRAIYAEIDGHPVPTPTRHLTSVPTTQEIR